MFYSNAHTHSTWCDGKDTMQSMAEAAIQLGFTDLGFTSHSSAPFDPSCPGVADESGYQKEAHGLQEQFKDYLTIRLGLEWDYYSPDPQIGYDYFVGSVHYLPPRNGVYRSVDESPETLMETLRDWYGGDNLLMIQDYYDTVVSHIQQHQPKIVGHFDLITKFNEKASWFDDKSSAYQKIALKALDNVIDLVQSYGGLVEVNTGAISRNWRTQPYPDCFLLQQLQLRECPVIVTSDSHETNTLNFHFKETGELLKSLGFTSTVQLKDGEFQKISF
ncbi:histidinol-phosphatase HisJ family protein [Enterococcus sp. AZ072]|uniref:histidinol-phosphatase HisJ family protein n=1 Tax=unclassified Enterococcus TaxID=2608891 RepID=UPI003D270C3A